MRTRAVLAPALGALITASAFVSAAGLSGAAAATVSDRALSSPVGTVVSAEPLARRLWVPGAAIGERLTYVSTNVQGQKALTTGEVFVPAGTAPAAGWKVISWAHGTSGLADGCAPSLMGPAEPTRDLPYLSTWIKQGYAIVATDYAGLGGPGLPAYLNGRSEARNIVDMVKAARAYAKTHLRRTEHLSNRWIVVGQSQGGGAAIYTARHATQYGGKALHYMGAIGTGVPAYIEDYVSLLGPTDLAPDPTGDLFAFMAYIIDSMRQVYPRLGLDQALTAEGRKWMRLADTDCVLTLADKVKSSNTLIGTWFNRPLASLPNWTGTVDAYMKMPEEGFDRPFFMGHGILDTDVPYPATAAYVAALEANHQPVTFKVYPTDHSGALVLAEKDEIPFAKALFAAE